MTPQPMEGFALLPVTPIAALRWISVHSGSRGRMGLPWLFIMKRQAGQTVDLVAASTS